jgi:hypothetical protein
VREILGFSVQVEGDQVHFSGRERGRSEALLSSFPSRLDRAELVEFAGCERVNLLKE